MSTRLPTRLLATALIRRTQAEGGFATVVHRGDDAAGAIMLQCTKMGRFHALVERRMTLDGDYEWAAIDTVVNKNSVELQEYITKKVAQDRDLWVIELDVAEPERLVAELGTLG